MPDATDAVARETVTPAQEAARLERGAVESLPSGALAEKLRLAAAEGRRLRVKLGIDPTAPDIHLGHAVVLGKLRELQDAGHRVVLIVGDYNARTFQGQAGKILDEDPERLEVRRNSDWLDMPLTDLLALVRTTTVAQLL